MGNEKWGNYTQEFTLGHDAEEIKNVQAILNRPRSCTDFSPAARYVVQRLVDYAEQEHELRGKAEERGCKRWLNILKNLWRVLQDTTNCVIPCLAEKGTGEIFLRGIRTYTAAVAAGIFPRITAKKGFSSWFAKGAKNEHWLRRKIREMQRIRHSRTKSFRLTKWARRMQCFSARCRLLTRHTMSVARLTRTSPMD